MKIPMVFVMTALLAACQQQAEAPKPTENTDGMSAAMPMAGEIKHGKSTGTVTAIDMTKGTVELDHGDIVELQWPAMKMGFSARPELLGSVKVGDKVEFELDWDGTTGTITRIAEVGS